VVDGAIVAVVESCAAAWIVRMMRMMRMVRVMWIMPVVPVVRIWIVIIRVIIVRTVIIWSVGRVPIRIPERIPCV